MSDKSARKARKRNKRRKEKRQATRATTGSPYQLVGRSGQIVACYVNRHWREDGGAGIYVLRRSRGRGMVLASFYIDVWCAGLKDAWGRLDMTMDEFQKRIYERASGEIELMRVDIDLVRRLVAGGIRFANQNGFRLPWRYERWVAVLGDVGDWRTADLSDFGVGDKLRYTGTLTDLRKRLVGCSLDEFLDRDDIEFIIGHDDFSLISDEEAEGEKIVAELHDRMLNGVRGWCFANGVAPHPRLPDAADVLLEAMAQAPRGPGDGPYDQPAAEEVTKNLIDLLELATPVEERDLQEAIDQLGRFVATFESPEEMTAALGLGDPVEDEGDPFG